MKYFNEFFSNTTAGTANQTAFVFGEGVRTGRVFYKLSRGGMARYSLLYTNIIDSTFSIGDATHCNMICDEWRIIRCRLRVFKEIDVGYTGDDFVTVTFGGSESKNVAPGEFFTTDPAVLSAEEGDWLCVELTIEADKGNLVPSHEENINSCYLHDGKDCSDLSGEWRRCNEMPFPAMVGCDRGGERPLLRIAYLGDSITQGEGTPEDSYTHWNAWLSRMIGNEYSFWNVGLGFGRAEDAASDGAWLFKAKKNDVVTVCYGINDMFSGASDAKTVEKYLDRIVDKLHAAGCKVLVQTLPPFNYSDQAVVVWKEINRWILEELSKKADAVFDVVPVLGAGKDLREAPYGGHPGPEGCKKWAEALYPALKELIDKTLSEK